MIDVLGHVPYAQPRRARNRAAAHMLLADEDAYDRRLVGAVRANQSDLVVGVDPERHIAEHFAVAVVLLDVLKSNQFHLLSPPTSAASGRCVHSPLLLSVQKGQV